MSAHHQTSKKQRLKELIDRALVQGTQQWEPRSSERHLYTVGLLTELLSYSAQDQMEVWQRLEYLANRPPKAKK